ncbi:GCN5-related N-acetyltransferase domain protein, partial [mine drainage metagenome]
MDERGIRSLKRVEMTADPGSFGFSRMNLPDGHTRLQIQSADLSAYSDALFSAFKSEDESILISSDPGERKKVLSDILSGRLYGVIIQEGSFALVHAGKVVGGVTTLLNNMIPIISDLFVVPEEHGKGLGSYLTESAVSSLRNYKEVRLWTDERSIAHEMYLHRGFTNTGRSETLYYLRKEKL